MNTASESFRKRENTDNGAENLKLFRFSKTVFGCVFLSGSQTFQTLTADKVAQKPHSATECGDFCGDAVSQWRAKVCVAIKRSGLWAVRA